VTGNNTFRYFKVGDGNTLKCNHSQIAKKEANISSNYTCHTWLPDGRILVCTDKGEILLLESTGDWKMMLHESPQEDFNIECIHTYSKGFIIAGDKATILIYEKSEEPKNPYTRIAKLPQSDGKIDKNSEFPELMA